MSRKPIRKASKHLAKTVLKKDTNVIARYRQSVLDGGIAHVSTLGSDDCSSSVRHWFSTGSLALDTLLNSRGIPAGRLTEIFGPSHIGKSTVLDSIMAQCQRAGGEAVLADTESARDEKYSRSIGVDVKRLVLLEFERGSLTVENVMDELRRSAEWWVKESPETPVVLGYDALGGTATGEEMEKRLGTSGDEDQQHTRPGGAAKVMRQACRQLIQLIANTKIAVVICNHEYQTINMGYGVGKKRETYGGDAIRLAASYRIEMYNARDGDIRIGDVSVGRKVGFKLVKNRLGKPWVQTEAAIISGQGFDQTWELYSHLVAKKIIQVSGGWAAINLDGEVLKFQGWNGLRKLAAEDPKLLGKLVAVYKQVFPIEEGGGDVFIQL